MPKVTIEIPLDQLKSILDGNDDGMYLALIEFRPDPTDKDEDDKYKDCDLKIIKIEN